MEPPTLDSKPEVKDDLLLSPDFLPPGDDTSSSSSPNSSSLHSGSPRHNWSFSGPTWNSLCDIKPHALDDVNLNLNLGLGFTSNLSQDQWPSMNIDTDLTTFIPDSTQHFSIDPSTLQLGPPFHESPHEPLSGGCDSMFQFMLSQPSDLALEPPAPIQLPSPQTVSISSRSTSPALSKLSTNGSAGVNPNDLSLLTQISQRAREAVGVTLAVPVEQKSKGVTEGQPPISPVSPIIAGSQPKMPIPRLRPTGPASQNPCSPTVQMPPNSQQPAVSGSESPEAVVTVPLTKSGRPKTSHTTIERRYRTNLNARILALRRAVPALRILEKNTPIQTQGKGLTGASAVRWDFDDVVNERGYVDGVKAAKKNSKGVVLGKAVEYIKALKRRETRLKREAQGLRELISGLVGGADLLREWEKVWRDRFGGEEADEVDEDADENEEGDADGEDAEDAEEGESEDEDGRAKKRARLEKKERKSKPSPAPQIEKRKRGRPRKNPPPDPPGELPHLILQPQEVQNQQQPSKYLMATFLLFNFFNVNSSSTKPSRGHEGSVLTHVPGYAAASADPDGWTILQATNMLVSLLLLLSLVGPYLPSKITRLLPHGLLFGSPGTQTSPSVVQKRNGHLMSTPPTRDMAVSIAYASGDEEALRNALRADGSLYSVLKCGGWALLENVKRAFHIRRKAAGMMTRHEEVALRGWRRISQLEVLHGVNTSVFSKIQTYFSFSSCLPSSPVSPSDRITLSLLAHSFSASIAAELWEMARHSDSKTFSEALVLELDVGEAVEILSASRDQLFDLSDEAQLSAVYRIAAHIVFNRTKALAARQFISSVSGQRAVDLDNGVGVEASIMSHDAEVKTITAVGKELGGALGDLTSLLNKVERCPAAEVLPTLSPFEFEIDNESGESSSESGSGSDGAGSVDAQFEDAVKDTRTLLLATVLYCRIFPVQDATKVHVLSPPPSPKSQSGGLHLTLRRALASRAFDASPDTEDARDRVVDMLAETRRGRSVIGGARNMP